MPPVVAMNIDYKAKFASIESSSLTFHAHRNIESINLELPQA
jgi:hypothetical protein